MARKPKFRVEPVYAGDDGKPLLPELEPGERNVYLATRGGAMVLHETPFYRAITPAKGFPMLAEVTERAEWLLPKIPASLVAQCVTFFRRIARSLETEAILLLYYVPADGRYALLCPEQVVTPVALKYDGISDPPEGWRLIGSIHSHVNMPAFHSGTDEEDEARFDGLHLTFGKLFEPAIEVVATIKVGTMRCPIPPTSVCDGLRPVWSAPDTVLVTKHTLVKIVDAWTGGLPDSGKIFQEFLREEYALDTLRYWLGRFLAKEGTAKVRQLEGYVVDVPEDTDAAAVEPDATWWDSVAVDVKVEKWNFGDFLRDAIKASVAAAGEDAAEKDAKPEKVYDRLVEEDPEVKRLAELHDAMEYTKIRAKLMPTYATTYSGSTSSQTAYAGSASHASRGNGDDRSWVTHDPPKGGVAYPMTEPLPVDDDGPPKQRSAAAVQFKPGMRVVYTGGFGMVRERGLESDLQDIPATIVGRYGDSTEWWLCRFAWEHLALLAYGGKNDGKRYFPLPQDCLEPLRKRDADAMVELHAEDLMVQKHTTAADAATGDGFGDHAVATDGLGSLQPGAEGDLASAYGIQLTAEPVAGTTSVPRRI